ncbi:hypothetical protein BX616_002376 [Lobosporangium transversale]|uniref:Chitin-binding type-4 domain-containing protein n=1 Tax=Lobosporangium transversale TaxID=64571 RepID=A0A1Y2GHU6_9FUNG|nr:hypothetical protein BCR41DRAFT_387756 [Lobosporangium transversale]KAF9916936.1 hypothetical protein BX616_002376 [Lobosporangium transversale]ORZ11301.1 hypothetical protein BCR41DRAFT_387756 [Lobosporangium transversale]|eukprot:XP_021879616.1 hypothetical protein BCR41DRAFT_387756 [Lobosporangium transversale]
MIFSKTAIIAAAVACLTVFSEAHVSLRSPCPRGAPFAGCPKASTIDYDITTPIGTNDHIGRPLCKNTDVQSKRAFYKAGQTIKTEYQIGAAHGGGHCQWALSYDEGKTWVVIQTLVRDCLRNVPNGGKYSVNVKIPKDAPSGKAIFMWLWNNAIGNRELYSNCVDIEINGKNGGKLKGVRPLIANYGPGTSVIGEFPRQNDADGHELFAKRKSITITVPKASKSKSKSKSK